MWLAFYGTTGTRERVRYKSPRPPGTPNEIAAFNVLEDVRRIVRDAGIHTQSIRFNTYTNDDDPEAPVRLRFSRYIAEAPRMRTVA